jgi:GNAT superfamily N-acetyltransferase
MHLAPRLPIPVAMGVHIETVSPGIAAEELDGLVALLADVVDGGASVGFLPPLAREEALAFWRDVAAAVGAKTRVLWVARADGEIVGSAQLELATKPNARHRAEVMKVMVLSRARRAGIGRALMQAVENEARCRNRTTLVLDTRQGDPSELLYRSLGWQPAGVVPKYALNGDGGVDPTVFYYKLLDGGS